MGRHHGRRGVHPLRETCAAHDQKGQTNQMGDGRSKGERRQFLPGAEGGA